MNRRSPYCASKRFETARRFEALEQRALMTAETVVGDAAFVLYDDAVVATAATDFSRDVPTIHPSGGVVGEDVRRYGEPIDYSSPLEWTDTGIDLGAGLQRILGTGWDHDGATPLLVHHNTPDGVVNFYRGADLAVVNSIELLDGDLMRGAVAGERFLPEAAIVHHGLIVIAAQRQVETDGVYTTVGIDFLATQDEGVTLERIVMADGSYGVPVVEQSEGMSRLAAWSFQNPFPVEGLHDTSAAWFPWADYITQDNQTKGGQIGLFRADRAEGEELWTVSPNRMVYSQWIEEDTGGLHVHTAAVTTGGMISHWGDVGYRSHSLFHQFDLNEYATATVQTTVAYGGFSSSPDAEQSAPQPVAAAPSPVAGEHFAGGDNTPDHILSIGSMDTAEDTLTVEAIVYQPERSAPGGVFGAAEVLHLQFVQGFGYVAQGNSDGFAYFSFGGEQWTEIATPGGSTSRIFMYGDRLLSVEDDRLWTAPLPTIETVTPLSIAPGGENLMSGELDLRRDPGTGNTVRGVVYDDGAWRYEDTLIPLDKQAPAPAWGADTLVAEVTMGEVAKTLGTWWLQPTGDTISTSQVHFGDVWVANLSTQGVTLGTALGAVNETTDADYFETTRYYTIHDNVDWISAGTTLLPEGDLIGRLAMSLSTYNASPGSRFLVAVPYAGQTDAATYSLDPLASGPDEVETVSIDPLSEEWSVGLIARLPENKPQRDGVNAIASLTGPTGDAVVISVDGGDGFIVDVYDDTQLIDSLVLETRTLRGDWFEFVVSSSGASSLFTVVVSGEQLVSHPGDALTALELDTMQWADRDGDVVAGIEPVLFVADDDEAWNAEQHSEWIGSSLTDKLVYQAKPAAGDFNSDGVVDAADYTFWRESRYTPVPGMPGDANLDGYADDLDLSIWRFQYGAAGEGLDSDFNADGVVDAIDYAIWREAAAAPQVPPGTGADGDGNGFVEDADRLVWEAAYGAEYTSLEELRAAAAVEPIAADEAAAAALVFIGPRPLTATAFSDPTPEPESAAAEPIDDAWLAPPVSEAPEGFVGPWRIVSEDDLAREEAFAAITPPWRALFAGAGAGD